MELGLQPVPDYLAAMRSGAGLGLNLRQQDVAEQDAANRLKLSYAHLAATQEAAKQRASALSAANILGAAHEKALLEHYTTMEESAKARADKENEPSVPQETNVGGMDLIYNPKSGHFIPKNTDKLTGESRVDDEALKQQMSEIGKQLSAGGSPKQQKALHDQYGSLLQQRKRLLHPPDPTTQYEPGMLNPMPNDASQAPTNEVVKTLKNGRKAVFDGATKKFLRYADGQ